MVAAPDGECRPVGYERAHFDDHVHLVSVEVAPEPKRCSLARVNEQLAKLGEDEMLDARKRAKASMSAMFASCLTSRTTQVRT